MNVSMLTELAEEAEFQAGVAAEYVGWLSAIAKAIALNARHSGGRDISALTDLVKFLDDSGRGAIDTAAEHFAKIAKSCSVQ